ncbi:hypothetical protein Scep_009474 [Stephania cephalantha]|uniref:Uncharacterized protein n=1 Tax=Stephania cephalantha TaxID=152367 RepID=A0AAP0EZ22_9MAGN
MIDHPSNKDMVDIVNSCILTGVGGKKARSCRKVLKRGAYQFKNIILYFCFA